jgi:basic membrane lipoprotein Med (substrate-binding protein (PBP1-ABC) superfamily)/fibronectin type 3 domain-containing protein
MLLALILSFGGGVKHAGAVSPAVASDFGSHRYQRIETTMPWHEARDYCASLGGHLVTINSAEENAFVYSLSPSSWLGASDEAVEGVWTWVTGEPWIYTNWAPYEPNNGTWPGHDGPYEHFLTFTPGYPGQWNDVPEDPVGGAFVCEWDNSAAHIGLITDGGVTDYAFNWMADQGLQQAASDLGVIGIDYLAFGGEQSVTMLQKCVDDGNDLCIGVGFTFGVLLANAARLNPGTRFAIVDYSYPDCWAGATEGVDCGSFTVLPNVRGLTFHAGQSGYLAGALIGKMTASNVIGAVGGFAIPPVVAFTDGYRNGAQCANSNVDVLVEFAGTFTDPGVGANMAQSMIARGADGIFNVAGPTGDGAILYSSQNEVWSIGVDADQYNSLFGGGTVDGSDKLLTSAMKRVDTSVYQTIEDLVGDAFTSGNVLYDLAAGGVGLAPYHETEGSIPQAVKDYIESVKAGILDGSVNIYENCRQPSAVSFVKTDAGSSAADLHGLAIGDLDGDGFPDIVTGAANGRIYAWQNDGSPFDSEWTSTLVGTSTDMVYGVGIADLDNDGHPDIVTGSGPAEDYEIIAWRNDGTPFDGGWTSQNVGAAPLTNLVALADLDNDSLVDIVSLGSGYGASGKLRIWRNDGTPFSGAWTGQALVTDESLAGLEVADLNKDGFTDIIYTYHEYYPRALMNDGTPWSGAWAGNEIGNACPGMTTGLEAADFNGDGWPDLATTCGYNPAQPQYVWQNDGSPFSGGWAANAFGTVKGANLAVADFNLDGDMDLVSDEGTTLAYWNNDGSPFSGGWGRTDLGNAAATIRRLAAADLDGDGDPDIVSVSSAAGAGYELQTWQNQVYFNLRVRAYIDGDTYLVVQGDSLYWHQNGADAPGRTGGHNDPTYVDGFLWYPSWPDVPDPRNRDCNCDSSAYTGFANPLLAQGQRVNLNVIQGRHEVTIVQQPSAENDYTLIVDFNDGPPGGADWYEVELSSNFQRPVIVAFPAQSGNTGGLGGDDWPRGLPVKMTINDPDTGSTVDYSDTQLPGDRPWSPDGTWITFDLGGAYTLLPGDVVTYANGLTTKTKIVTGLQVTDIDTEHETISGTDTPGMIVQVWVDNPGGWNERRTTAGLDGAWSVDFSVPGDSFPAIEISPGATGQAKSYDADWDSTQIGWRAPNPNFTVRANWDQVEVFDWPLGSTITLEIDDPATPDDPDYSEDRLVEAHPKDPNQTYVFFDLWNVFDIQPGFDVRLSGGGTDKTLNVSVLSFDPADVDVVADTVHGIASPNAPVFVWACGAGVPEGHYRNVTADGDGNWTADFGHWGDEDDEQNTFDIRPGASINTNEMDADGDTTLFWQNVPNPQISVRANGDGVEAYEFPLGSTVTLEINDPSTPADPDYSASQTVGGNPKDPSYSYAQFNLWGVFDIQPGFEVRMSQGATTKTLIVSPLAFTDIDLLVDTVRGSASPDTRIDIWVCPREGGGCTNRHVDANGSGDWLADFGHEGDEDDEHTTVDIRAGAWIDSQEYDGDNDRTMFGQNVPYPQFSVRANSDNVEVYEFPQGSTVTLEINDPATPANPDYTDSQVVGGDAKNPDQTYASFNLYGIFDIQPGFEVDVSQGVTEKTLIVSPLAFSDIDLVLDTVTGSASPHARVDIWACPRGYGDCLNRHVEADGSGNWVADFGHKGDEDDEQNTFDIKRGTWIDSQQWDDDSDRTMYGESVPNPYIEVNPNSNWLHAREWPLGVEVTLTIDDPSNGAGVDYTDTATMQQAPWNPGDPNDIVADFTWPDIGVQPGFILTMSGDGVNKELVVPPLSVSEIDPLADTVAGFATPGVKLQVCANIPNNCITRWVDTDPTTGAWTADFGKAGTSPDDPRKVDLVPGSNGWVNEEDSDSDRTSLDWRVPNPNIGVRANGDQVEAWEWPLGNTVTLEIDDPATPANPDYSDTRLIEPADWNPSQTYAWFDLNGIFDIQPGFLVRLDDGTTEKTLTVSVLSFTDIDKVAETVTGIASPGARVDVWACPPDKSPYCSNRHVDADGSGNWIADFGHKGDEGDEQDTFNITFGVNIDSQEYDDDGDRTLHGQQIRNPRIEVEAWNNRLSGYEFIPDADVTVTVDDPSTPANPDYQETKTANGNGDMEFWPELDILPGFVVMMTDGDADKGLVVSVLHATANEATNTVSGIASPSVHLKFWVDDSDLGGAGALEVIAGAGGNWNVDLDGLYTLHTWTFGGVYETDPDGDGTYYRWRVVHPTIEAWLNENSLKIFDWPLGADLTVTIDDPATLRSPDYLTHVTTEQLSQPFGTQEMTEPLSPDYTVHVTSEPTPWFEGTWAYLLLDNALYLKPGMLVSVSGGGVSDSMTISKNQVSTVDFDNDAVLGVTDMSMAVNVVLDDGGDARSVVSDGDGYWMADFSGSYDIGPGTKIDVKVHDADWDATILQFYASTAQVCMPGNQVTGFISDLNGGKLDGSVTVYFDDFDSETPLFTTLSAPDGWYGCGNLSADDYRVWVDMGSLNGVSYSRQYYDQTIFENANRVTVGAGTHLSGMDIVYDTPDSTYMHIDFNMSRPITGELAVRRAIAYGTDRQRINDSVAPGAPVMDSFIPQGAWSHATSGLPNYTYNPTLAASILTAAGWADTNADGVREKAGERLHLDIYMRNEWRRVEAAKILQENMAAIGMEIDIHVVSNFGGHIYNHDFDLAIFGWVGDENADFGEDGTWWLFKSDGPNNVGLYNSADVDAQLAALRPLRTRAGVLPHATQIQVDVMTDLATLPLFAMWAAPPKADAGPDQTIPEGSSATMDGSGSGDPYNDLVAYAWDTDGDGAYDDATGVNPSVPFYDNGVYNVNLQVTDAYSMTAKATLTITVTNVAPTATFNAPAVVVQGSTIPISLTSPHDASPVDGLAGFQYAFDCGSGGGYGAFGSSNFTTCPTAGSSGMRTVGGKIRDKDGGVSEYTRQVAILVPPANVRASDGTFTDKVQVTWDAVAGATSYRVFRAASETGTKSLLGTLSASPANDIVASPGVTYYYWVKACNGAICSDFGAFDTGWRMVSPPANVQASDGAFTDKVQVTWNAATGALSYRVYRATSPTGSKTLLGSPAAFPYNDTGATPGTSYYYWVKSCTATACSDFSASDTGWRKPLAPTGLTASDGTYIDKVVLAWSGVGGATSYQVYRATSATGVKAGPLTTGATTINDTSATPGVTYWYWVKACRGANCSDFSAYDPGWRNLAPPTNLQASDGTYPDRVQVTWSASLGATSYRLYRATSAGGTKTLLGSPTSTSANDTSATPGTTYYYWVTACRAAVCSDYSAYDTGRR